MFADRHEIGLGVNNALLLGDLLSKLEYVFRAGDL